MDDPQTSATPDASGLRVQIPSAFFGVTPGEDRVLVRWQAMLAYFEHLAANSDRLAVQRIGQSTEGRDLALLVVAAPEVLSDLQAVRARRATLNDPAHISDPRLADGS
ncbi:MAG: hypothetical protein ACTHMX_06315, partial [Thermomicrobiales bacterium]